MMMISDLTAQELQAAGYLIEAARDRIASKQSGVNRWDRAGIVGHLQALSAEPLDQALAIALTAANDPDAATPAAFSWTKYRRRPHAIASSGGRGPVCRHCMRTRYACERAQINTGQDPHEFEPEQP